MNRTVLGGIITAVMALMLLATVPQAQAQSPLCFTNNSSCSVTVKYTIAGQNQTFNAGTIAPGATVCINSGGVVTGIFVGNSTTPITPPAAGSCTATGLNCPDRVCRAGGPPNTFVFF